MMLLEWDHTIIALDGVILSMVIVPVGGTSCGIHKTKVQLATHTKILWDSQSEGKSVCGSIIGVGDVTCIQVIVCQPIVYGVSNNNLKKKKEIIHRLFVEAIK